MEFSFLSGAAEGATKELSDQQNRAFQLKLLNAQIESRLASPEVSESLGHYTGVNNKPGQRYNPTDVSAALGMGRSQAGERNAQAKASAMGGKLKTRIVGDGPNMKMVWFNENEPGAIRGELPIGQNPQMYKAYAKTASEYAPVKITVDNLADSVRELLSDKGVLAQGATAADIKLSSLLKKGDPRVIDLVNNRKGYALQIAAVVNRGRPSDPDAKAIELMLPNEFDSIAFAEKKIARVQSMMEAAEESDYNMYMAGNLPEFRNKGNKGGPDKGQPSREDIKAERERRAKIRAERKNTGE